MLGRRPARTFRAGLSLLRSAEEVFVRDRELVGTEIVDLQIRLSALDPGLLRVDHLLEERLFRLLGDDPVPGRELRIEDRFAGVDDADVALPDLFKILGV